MPGKKREPAAFLSYARFDDAHAGGRVVDLARQLANEVRAQTGRPFPLFVDRKDIAWGESWRRRIEGALDASTFLIPVVTPSFFTSKGCRGELWRFLQREQELGRDDLVLPIYFVDAPHLNEPGRRDRDALAVALAGRQWADFRKLRFEKPGSARIGRALEKLATRLRDAIEADRRPKKKRGPRRAAR